MNRSTPPRKQCGRLVSLDLLRLFFAAAIFLFHTNIHLGSTYGILTDFVSQGAICMDGFFLLSGFVTYYTSCQKDMYDFVTVKRFLKKRLAGIYPGYLVACIAYLFIGAETSLQKLLLIPVNIPVVQASLDGSFGTSHHGGTWFVSCLVFCYLLSPYFITLLRQFTRQQAIKGYLAVYFLCSYMPTHVMGYSTLYASVIYRVLQFFLGAVLGALFVMAEKPQNDKLASCMSMLMLPALICGVSILFRIAGNFRDYDFFAIPVFSVMIYFSAFLPFDSALGKRISNSKMVSYANAIAYEFFLGQLFCMKLTLWLKAHIPVALNGTLLAALAFAICMMIAVTLHEYVTKPAKKLFT